VHERRFAVVLSNGRLCRETGTPLIVIAPMTHTTHVRNETDVLIEKSPENGLEFDSLAQLALNQPVIKSAIMGKLGVLSDVDYDSILLSMIAMTSR